MGEVHKARGGGGEGEGGPASQADPVGIQGELFRSLNCSPLCIFRALSIRPPPPCMHFEMPEKGSDQTREMQSPGLGPWKSGASSREHWGRQTCPAACS